MLGFTLVMGLMLADIGGYGLPGYLVVTALFGLEVYMARIGREGDGE